MCSGFFSSSIRANRENKPPLPQIYDDRFVEQLKPFIPHLKVAKFFGGEPFLIDIYYDIWELFIASNPKCEIIITTNGTVFTNKVQRMLENLNFQAVISLDSVNKPTYENIRRNATMERTLEHVEKYRTILQERGKTVVMAVCPMVMNWREIPDLIAFANERGMPIFFNTVTFPESASLKYLPVAEQRRVAEFFRQSINKNPHGKIETANSRALTDLSHQVEMWCTESNANASELLQIV
jgi:MoaA/NifB/PqqE/SkfB family radical SAM enzyme